MTFAQVIADAAVGEEAARVVDDDRRLLDEAHEIKRGGDSAVAGLLALDDLDERHLVDRREEVDADIVLRVERGLGERGDRQGRCVRREDHLRPDNGLRLLGRFFLDRTILEHRFDDEVAALEVVVVRARRDAREQRVLVGRLRSALHHAGRHQVFRIGLALVGRRLVAVDQHDLRTARRRDVSNACAHHAGAEHADLFDRRARRVFWPARALFEFALRQEERADHRCRFLGAHDLCEITALDFESGVHRQLQAFIDAGEDGFDGRVVVVGFLAVDRIGRRPHHHAAGREDFAGRRLELFVVPWRDGTAAIFDPLFRA